MSLQTKSARWPTRLLVGALWVVGVAGLFGVGAAFAYWTVGASNNPAVAIADSLGSGSAPASATTTAPNSNTVDVVFSASSTSVGDVTVPSGDYLINRYPSGGGSATAEVASCTGTTTITCAVSAVPDGRWMFTDTPSYGDNWIGTESDDSPTVTVDTTPPTGAITYPVTTSTYGANWSGVIDGTASDATSGVASVAVAVEDTTTGLWFNGANFAAASQDFLSATGTTSWSYDLASDALTSEHSYAVVAEVNDNATNIYLSAPSTFTYNTTAPSVSFTYPVSGTYYNAAGWTGSITGTASDSVSGVASVVLTIEDTTTTQYWNGSGWQGGATTVPATGTTSWSDAFSSTNLTDGDGYTVTVTATNNVAVSSDATTTFTYDTTPPTATVTYPVSGTYYNAAGWTGSITGSASDAVSGVGSVSLTIENTTTTQYWNGSTWQGGATTVPATGTTSWSDAFSDTNLTDGDSYAVTASATDNANNTGTSTTSTFSYDTTPPTASVTYPVSGTYYNAAGWTAEGATLSGTAGDTFSGVASNALTLENTTTTQYWTGSTWQSGATTFAATGTTSWSNGFSSSHLTNGDSYSLTDTATDNAGNATTSAATTFTYDTTPPTATVTYPVSGTYYNAAGWSGSITGSASDAVSGVGSVSLTIENTTTTQYWNGSTWQGGATSVAASGTTSWSDAFSDTNLTDGDSYAVTASATDNANNTGTSTTSTFSYDTTPPTATVTYPVSGTYYNAAGWTAEGATLSGTAGDTFSGVASNALTLENTTTTQYWTGSTWQSGATTFAATGTTSWSNGFSSSHLTNGDSYSLTDTATDNAGNATTSAATTFTYDTTPPTATVTYPVSGTYYNAAGWTGSITGSASDAVSGVGSVSLTIENTTTTQYWNGSTWQSGATSVAASGTTSWSDAFSDTNLTDGDSYAVTASATDNANNTGTSTTSTFSYDTTPPTANVLYPSNGEFYNASGWTGSITGSAADTFSGVASVSLTLENTTTTQYWNGSTWQSGATMFAATGTTIWSDAFSDANLTDGNSYAVTASATDYAGNSGTSATTTFTYDTSAPSVSVTYPVTGTFYDAAGWSGSIYGSASDSVSGVASVSVTIENTTTTQYWNGSTWQSGTTSVPATGTTSWSYALSGTNLTSGDAYTATAVATNNAEITSGAASSFTYNTTGPTVTITVPVSGTYYNAAGWTADGATLSGTSAPAVGSISTNALTLKNTTTTQYWNGSTWQTGATTFSPSGGTTASWTNTFSSANFTNGDTYTLTDTATDNAGNATTSATTTFTYNTTGPTVTITEPVSGTYYGSSKWSTEGATLSGTSVPAVGSVATNALTLENTTTTQYWTGSTWQTGATTFSPSGGTTGSWTNTFSSANLTNGDSYTLTDTATDNAGNATTSAATTFTYDTTPPTATVTYPVSGTYYNAAGWTGSITGSASDAVSGVGSVSLTIENTTTTQYWNGSTWQGGATTVPASGTTSWSDAFSDTNLTDGDSYAVTASATDNANNTGTSATSTFSYDTTPPTATVTYPVSGTYYNAAGWTAEGATLSGTAGDTFSGVATNALTLKNTTTTQYWTGSTWQTGATTFSPSGGTTGSWTNTFSSANLTNGDSYTLTDTATDNAGNATTSAATTFTYDTTPPTATVTYPVSGTYYNAAGWTGSITGSASDAVSGVGSVSLTIENTTTTQYWNGSTWQGGATTVPATGTTSWSDAFSDTNLTDGDSYAVTASATDNANNTGTSATITFSYDTTPPTATVTYPVSGTYYNAAGWTAEGATLSGTAGDTFSGVATNALTLENTTTTQYWTGSAWQSGATTFSPSGGTTASWSNGFVSSNLITGDTYTLEDTATDNAGNATTSAATTFTYNTTGPTATVTEPVSGTYYNAAGWTAEGATLSGTSTPAVGSVSTNALTLENTTAGKYWTGSAWQSGATTFAATGTTSWSNGFVSSNLITGDTYTLKDTATDNAGNATTSAATTFTYNTTGPTVTVTEPVSGTYYNAAGWTAEGATLSGTSTPAVGSVSTNALTLENTTTTQYWTGSTWQSGATTFAATGTTSWSNGFSSSHLTTGDSYSLTDTATDNAGNATTSAAITFTYNTTGPTVTVTEPVSGTYYNAAGWTAEGATLSGTSTPAVGSVSTNALTLENTTTTQYWTGSAWQSGATTFSPSGGTTASWSNGFVSSNLITGDTYTLKDTATDNAGNATTSAATTFTYNTTGPTVTVTEPVSGTYFNAAGWTAEGATLSGTSTPAVGSVSTNALTLENTTTTQYWTGSAWQTGATTFSPSGGTTASWSNGFLSSNLITGDTYTLKDTATDNAGNATTSAATTFTYNTTGPTVTVTEPVSGTYYGSSKWTAEGATLSGTSTPAVGSVSTNALTLENTTAGKYWTGSAWQTGATTFSPSGGTTASWSNAFLSSNLITGDTYTLKDTATDNAGNATTSATTTFYYSTTAPTVGVSYPVSASTYYGTSGSDEFSGSISGTAAETGGSGLSAVTITIENTTTGDYWNGSAFVSGVQTLTATGTTSWSYTFARTNLTSGDSYAVTATAVDNAGNTTSSAATSFYTLAGLAWTTTTVTPSCSTESLTETCTNYEIASSSGTWTGKIEMVNSNGAALENTSGSTLTLTCTTSHSGTASASPSSLTITNDTTTTGTLTVTYSSVGWSLTDTCTGTVVGVTVSIDDALAEYA